MMSFLLKRKIVLRISVSLRKKKKNKGNWCSWNYSNDVKNNFEMGF